EVISVQLSLTICLPVQYFTFFEKSLATFLCETSQKSRQLKVWHMTTIVYPHLASGGVYEK
ncbi:hypothetical protein OFC58_41040, partial [Escherichia coli]|nr:hypothetical protein [Escherichia coli]